MHRVAIYRESLSARRGMCVVGGRVDTLFSCPDVFTGSLSKPVAALVKSAISKDPRAGNATGSSPSSSTSACGRMITTVIVHGVGVPPPPVMSMSGCAHRERGGCGPAAASISVGRTPPRVWGTRRQRRPATTRKSATASPRVDPTGHHARADATAQRSAPRSPPAQHQSG